MRGELSGMVSVFSISLEISTRRSKFAGPDDSSQWKVTGAEARDIPDGRV